MTAQFKVTPHPLHDWQDEQRRKDEPENRIHEIKAGLLYLKGIGMGAEADEICMDFLFGPAK